MAGQVAESRGRIRLIYEDGKVVLTGKKEQDWSKVTYNVLTEDELDEIFEKHPFKVNKKLDEAGFVVCTEGDYIFAEQRYAALSILSILNDDYYRYKHVYDPNSPIKMFATSDFTEIDEESFKKLYRKIQKEVFEVLSDFRSLDEKQYYQKHISMIDKINTAIDRHNIGDDFTELSDVTTSYYLVSRYKEIERQKHAEYQFELKNSNNKKVTCNIVYHNNDYTSTGRYGIRYIKDRYIGFRLNFDDDEAFSYITFLECPYADKYDQEILFDILLYIYKKTHNEDVLEAMLQIAKYCSKYKEIFVNDVDYDDDDIPF